MKTLVIARLTFLEAARRRILLAGLMLGLLFLLVFGLGINAILKDLYSGPQSVSILLENEIFNFFTMAGFYVVNFLTIMLSVLTSVDTLSGEIGSGTIQSIVTKPLNRWEIITGKWLGFVGLLSLYILLMAGGVALVMFFMTEYTINNLGMGIFLLWLNGVLMLSVSLLGGAFLSTLANGVLVFGLFGVSFVGGWIEQIGALIQNEAAVNIGILTSLLLPTEALWHRAAFEMQSPLISSFGFTPFSSSASVPSPMMLWYAIGYVIVAVLLGIRIFGKRDL